MRVLLVHNYYGSAAPSGENVAVDAERDLLLGGGHEVLVYSAHSDVLRAQGLVGCVRGGISAVWNVAAVRQVERLIAAHRPDVVHVHNTFPMISPAVLRVASRHKVATVMTLHNFRVACAAGVPERDGQPCTKCIDRHSVGPALWHGCYRRSHIATIPVAAMIAFHRMARTWSFIDRFIALTPSQRSLLEKAGIPGDRVDIKPHFYSDPPEPIPWSARERSVLCVGRLDRQKGVHVLVEAWRRWGAEAPRLDIIGDGPERSQLEAIGRGANVAFSGRISFSEVQQRLRNACLLVIPSLCYEGFPMVVREAYALGVPVVASAIGALKDLVRHGATGLLFTPGDPASLLRELVPAWRDSAYLAQMAVAAREEFLACYTAEKNLELLADIYRRAIARRERLGSGSC